MNLILRDQKRRKIHQKASCVYQNYLRKVKSENLYDYCKRVIKEEAEKMIGKVMEEK